MTSQCDNYSCYTESSNHGFHMCTNVLPCRYSQKQDLIYFPLQKYEKLISLYKEFLFIHASCIHNCKELIMIPLMFFIIKYFCESSKDQCFYFYPLCYAAELLKFIYYAQYYAQVLESLSDYIMLFIYKFV